MKASLATSNGPLTVQIPGSTIVVTGCYDAGMQSDIRLVELREPDGFQQHVNLQDLVWGPEPGEAVPTHLLIASARNGAMVLGAYDGDDMVGCLYGLHALHAGRLTHLSHLLAVHPDYRGRGIGEALKWRQRELVLAQGIDTVTWTFDPLQALNARLNLSRLGGYSATYVRDYYGAMADSLNAGLPSDRLVLTWRLDAPAVAARARGDYQAAASRAGEAAVALGSEPVRNGLRAPVPSPHDAASVTAVLVEVPANVAALKQQDAALALRWRLAVRAALEGLFAAGYVANDVLRREGRSFYYVSMDR